MSDTVGVIGVMIPVIALLMPVAIVWIVMHYKSQARQQTSLSAEELQQLEALTQLARRLEARVQTLETILDAESPQWREQHEQ